MYYQVDVLAGISRRGATLAVIFTGKMNSAGFQHVLMKCIKPLIKDKF